MSYLDEGKSITLISILWAIRDSRKTTGVMGAERTLLEALAIRCDPKTNYSCFPGYKLLAADTGHDASTLRKLAKVLEGKHLIRRKVRRNRSNIFTLNIKRLWRLAAAEIAATEEAEFAAKFAAYEDDPIDEDEEVDATNPGSSEDIHVIAEGEPSELVPTPVATPRSATSSPVSNDDWYAPGWATEPTTEDLDTAPIEPAHVAPTAVKEEDERIPARRTKTFHLYGNLNASLGEEAGVFTAPPQFSTTSK